MISTTSRLFQLLSLLQLRRDWPGQVLAERLGISHRTVRRDVDRLRDLGYRIQAVMGPDGGYRLDAGSELPPLIFDDEQAVALAVALRAAASSGAGVGEAAVRALGTVRQVLPARLRHRLDALDFTAVPSRRDVGSVAPEVLLAISGAVRNREVLRFDYASSEDLPRAEPAGAVAELPPVRRAEPHHLALRDGRWYLIAWDLGRADWRIFRADRITPRIPSGPQFTPRALPGEGVGEFLSARFKGSAAGTAWPCSGKVIIELPAREVSPFAGDGTVEDLGPDRCSLEAGSWSWTALAAWLGRFDAGIDVVGPPELAAEFGRLAARYSAAAGRFRPQPVHH